MNPPPKRANQSRDFQLALAAMFAFLSWMGLAAFFTVIPFLYLRKFQLTLPMVVGSACVVAILFILYYLLAAPLRCQVCGGPVFGGGGKHRKHPNARKFLGLSYSRRVAWEILTSSGFHCMHCHTLCRKRRKAGAVQPAPMTPEEMKSPGAPPVFQTGAEAPAGGHMESPFGKLFSTPPQESLPQISSPAKPIAAPERTPWAHHGTQSPFVTADAMNNANQPTAPFPAAPPVVAAPQPPANVWQPPVSVQAPPSKPAGAQTPQQGPSSGSQPAATFKSPFIMTSAPPLQAQPQPSAQQAPQQQFPFGPPTNVAPFTPQGPQSPAQPQPQPQQPPFMQPQQAPLQPQQKPQGAPNFVPPAFSPHQVQPQQMVSAPISRPNLPPIAPAVAPAAVVNAPQPPAQQTPFNPVARQQAPMPGSGQGPLPASFFPAPSAPENRPQSPTSQEPFRPLQSAPHPAPAARETIPAPTPAAVQPVTEKATPVQATVPAPAPVLKVQPGVMDEVSKLIHQTKESIDQLFGSMVKQIHQKLEVQHAAGETSAAATSPASAPVSLKTQQTQAPVSDHQSAPVLPPLQPAPVIPALEKPAPPPQHSPFQTSPGVQPVRQPEQPVQQQPNFRFANVAQEAPSPSPLKPLSPFSGQPVSAESTEPPSSTPPAVDAQRAAQLNEVLARAFAKSQNAAAEPAANGHSHQEAGSGHPSPQQPLPHGAPIPIQPRPQPLPYPTEFAPHAGNPPASGQSPFGGLKPPFTAPQQPLTQQNPFAAAQPPSPRPQENSNTGGVPPFPQFFAQPPAVAANGGAHGAGALTFPPQHGNPQQPAQNGSPFAVVNLPHQPPAHAGANSPFSIISELPRQENEENALHDTHPAPFTFLSQQGDQFVPDPAKMQTPWGNLPQLPPEPQANQHPWPQP